MTRQRAMLAAILAGLCLLVSACAALLGAAIMTAAPLLACASCHVG